VPSVQDDTLAPGDRPLHVKLVRRRWYWDPPDKLRKSHNLKTVALGADQAAAWAYARTLNRDHLGLGPKDAPVGSILWMFNTFIADDKFEALAASTKRDYRWLLLRVLATMELSGRPLGGYLATQIKARHADAIYGLLKESIGHSSAHYACRVARRVWHWGGRREMVDRIDNPWTNMELKGIPQRTQRWTADQVDIVCAKAIELEAPSVGLAVSLAYWWGHRQGDVLALTWEALDSGNVSTSKTGQVLPVDIDAYPILRTELATERARQTLKAGATASGPVVVCEATGKRWERHGFGHAFRDIATAAGIPKTLQFRDLRATAVTELSDAGADPIGLSTHSGHQTISMARRYARRTPEQFTAAAGKRLERRRST
jgi:site-specific recombinase XerD